MTHTVRKDTEEGCVVSLETAKLCKNERESSFGRDVGQSQGAESLKKQNEERRKKQEALVRRLVECAEGCGKSVA